MLPNSWARRSTGRTRNSFVVRPIDRSIPKWLPPEQLPWPPEPPSAPSALYARRLQPSPTASIALCCSLLRSPRATSRCRERIRVMPRTPAPTALSAGAATSGPLLDTAPPRSTPPAAPPAHTLAQTPLTVFVFLVSPLSISTRIENDCLEPVFHPFPSNAARCRANNATRPRPDPTPRPRGAVRFDCSRRPARSPQRPLSLFFSFPFFVFCWEMYRVAVSLSSLTFLRVPKTHTSTPQFFDRL